MTCLQVLLDTFPGSEVVTDPGELEHTIALAAQSDWVRRWNDWLLVLEDDRRERAEQRRRRRDDSLGPAPSATLEKVIAPEGSHKAKKCLTPPATWKGYAQHA